MRYYLDTNILLFIAQQDWDSLHHDIVELLNDYETQLLTSSVCVVELIHLLQIGKVRLFHSRAKRSEIPDMLEWLERTGIRVVHTSDAHLRQMNKLPIHTDTHRDPFDRFIISQAIADRIPLVSSDQKFHLYEGDGLELIFNKR